LGSGFTGKPSRGSECAALSREIRRAGLLDRRRGYYLIKIVLNLAVFAAGWVAFVAIGDSWWQLLMAVFFVAMFTRLSFIGTSSRHRHVSASSSCAPRRGNGQGYRPPWPR
jgi:hypothetical protein